MALLDIRAGASAYASIKDNGLRPEDVAAVFGASGAAKWLTISELDAAIFGEWLVDTKSVIHLFGTSVGAWKLAAAAQNNPKQALQDFAQAYCQQQYGNKITHADIQKESDRIIGSILTPQKIHQVLTHPHFRYHCGAVRCKSWLASESKPLLATAMLAATIGNCLSPHFLDLMMERVFFSDPRTTTTLFGKDRKNVLNVALNEQNFVEALSASGSIPYLMAGITDVGGCPKGMYRDGGLMDYHPVPGNIFNNANNDDRNNSTFMTDHSWPAEKIILYPHFYPHVIPGWFDKFLPWRIASADQLSNVVLISPTREYIDSLPNNRIPDRHDFNRYLGRDRERITLWQQAIDRGKALAQEFLELADSSRFGEVVQAL